MDLLLDNGATISYDFNKKTIFFGPNSIGKTQISKALKRYYEDNNLNVLLFDDNILNDMMTDKVNENNSFEIMPKVQEYNKYNNVLDELKNKLKFKEGVKKICGVDTKKAFASFENLSSYVDKDLYTYNGLIKDTFFNTDELKVLFKKPKTGLVNFFELIDDIIKKNISVLPNNILNMAEIDIYNIQNDIVSNREKYSNCPVCYREITDEIIIKMKKNIERGTLETTLKESLLFYMNEKNEKIRNTIISFLSSKSYEESKTDIVKQVENDVLFYLNEFYNSEDIKLYIENNNNLNKILEQIKNFQLKENSQTRTYIKDKLKCHSIFKESDFDIEVEDGKLKITGLKVDVDNMSKSEQNFFKFLYFDILVYQKKEEGNLHIIIDDPFDSYDDIHVQDSINIIKNLIDKSIDKIDSFNIFSHSLYIIHLYNEVNNKFEIKWLDKFENSNIINIYDDKYELLKKVDINPYDYALILKLSEILVDKYSLIVFSSLLRTEIQIEKILFNKNNNNENQLIKNKIKNLYDEISESVNHCKKSITIKELSDMINSLFYYDLHDNLEQTVDNVINDVTSDINPINIAVLDNNNKINILDNDVCYILIYKYLLGLKIRRLFEEKARNDANYTHYRNIGQLMKRVRRDDLKLFYATYNFVLNSFNHISAKLVPPPFIYTVSALQKCYNELNNL